MLLGDKTFPIDDFETLPYRDLIDLRDILRTGLASPFWSAYREIVDGSAKNFEKAILAPLASPSLDLAFTTEFLRGQLAATRIAAVSMETLLAEVQSRIDELQAQATPENSDERRTDQPDTRSSP